MNKNRNLLAIFVITLAILACSSFLPQVQDTIPQTEADVPRISVEDAKAALDGGKAVIVDVRSVESYAKSHIADALSIPLDRIEADPAGVSLDPSKWIITYCT